jgi:hypothetical protein
MIRVICCGLALLVVSCADPTPHEYRKYARSSTGQLLCGVHKIPLVTVRAYSYSSERPIFLDHPIGLTAEKDEKCNPNPIPRGYSLRRTKDLRYPTEVQYCPWCQDGVGCDFE